MAKTIKTRLENLEAYNPDNDHDWTIEIFMDANDHLHTKHYKDGQEVSLAQYNREFNPIPGPIQVNIID